MPDYFTALGLQDEDAFYRVADTPENQEKLSRAFQAAFNRWQGSLKP